MQTHISRSTLRFLVVIGLTIGGAACSSTKTRGDPDEEAPARISMAEMTAPARGGAEWPMAGGKVETIDTEMDEATTTGLQGNGNPPWLADRGDGIHTSLFGTHVREGESLLYLFYEYTVNHDAEYKPEELGFVGSTDFTARRVDREALLFMAYGLSRDVMVEFESAVHAKSSQSKASGDVSAMPDTLSESGLGDTEGQVRWRFKRETEDTPELTAFLEVVFPLQRSDVLIGTQDWELSTGINITKGFGWGTLSQKLSLAYTAQDQTPEFGEWSLEYLKRVSDAWRVVLAVEGEQDEIQGIAEAQWQIAPGATIKLNSGFGLTPKAPDWAPEVGILFSF